MPKILSILSILAVSMYTAVMGYSLGIVAETDSTVASALLRNITRRNEVANTYAPRTWKKWDHGRYGKDGQTYEGATLSYPRDFEVTQGAAGGSILGTQAVKIAFPQDAFRTPKTNFSSAFISVSSADDPAAVMRCFENPTPTEEEPTLTTVVTVNGIAFRRGFVTQGAAGSVYDTRVYRTLKGEHCYEVALTVQTANIGNFTPGSVAEFDKDRAFRILEKVLQTFAFTDMAPR